MSERRLTTDAEMVMRERLARDDVLPRAYDMMRGAYRADVNRLLSEVIALRQERDEARAMLAHVADLIQKQLESSAMHGLTIMALTIAAEKARLAAEGGSP